MNFLKVNKNFVLISLKKISAYRFELWMTLFQLLFNLSFIVIFWYSLLQYIPSFAGWEIGELLLYTSFVSFGEGIAGIFFGLRDLPERILEGEIDKYLTRPMNVLSSMLLENVSILYFVEQVIISILMIGIVIYKFQIRIIYSYLAISLANLLMGVVTIQMMIGALTFASFWIGKIESLRELFMNILMVQEYPANVFPSMFQHVLTYAIPVYFVAYYPCALLLGKELFDIKKEASLIILSFSWMWLFRKIWKMGLRRYEANGG